MLLHTSQDLVILHLSLLDGVGPITIKTIIERLPVSFNWQDIYQFSVVDWQRLVGLSAVVSTAIKQGLQNSDILARECALIERYAISWITVVNTEYPSSLSATYAAPAVLYWQGSQLLNNDVLLACIGSRQANVYGKRVIDLLIPPLVAAGCTIVSGGALGADAMAHRATLVAQGKRR